MSVFSTWEVYSCLTEFPVSAWLMGTEQSLPKWHRSSDLSHDWVATSMGSPCWWFNCYCEIAIIFFSLCYLTLGVLTLNPWAFPCTMFVSSVVHLVLCQCFSHVTTDFTAAKLFLLFVLLMLVWSANYAYHYTDYPFPSIFLFFFFFYEPWIAYISMHFYTQNLQFLLCLPAPALHVLANDAFMQHLL